MRQTFRLFARYRITFERRYPYPYEVWGRWWRFYLIPTWGFSPKKLFKTYEEALDFIAECREEKQNERVRMGGSVFF